MTSWTIAHVEKLLAKLVGSEGLAPAAERKRQRIIDAATELFIQHGYRRTSVDDIAARAGVAKGTVYLYAKNKAELLFHAIVDERRRSLELLAPVLAEGITPRERLYAWVRTAIATMPRIPLTAQLMSGNRELLHALDDLDAEVRIAMEAVEQDLVKELLVEAAHPAVLAGAELAERANVMRSVLLSIQMADPRVQSKLSLERYAERVATLLVDGVLATPAMEARKRR